MSFNPIPTCVHALPYRDWGILIELNQPSPDADKSYQFVTYRNGFISQKSGFASVAAALDAAISSVDSDAENYQSFAA